MLHTSTTQIPVILAITACTVVQAVVSHGPCQWERAIFDPPQLRDPSTDFHETWNI